jgi:hypothetical protein
MAVSLKENNCFFLLRIKLRALIQLEVSRPVLTQVHGMEYCVGLVKAINHWRKLAWTRFEPSSPKWHTGALSTTYSMSSCLNGRLFPFLNTFVVSAFISPFNTQTMHVNSFYTQQHCYVSLKSSYPGGIWTSVIVSLGSFFENCSSRPYFWTTLSKNRVMQYFWQ